MGFLLQLCGGRDTKLRVNRANFTLCLTEVSTNHQGLFLSSKLTDKRLPKLQLTLRPARSHKFRLEYLPIKYEASTTLTRNIDFNGQRYRLGIPANTTLDWKAYRFAYEFDFVTKNRGFAGFIIE